MDAALAKKWMLLFNEKIQANKDYLSELDTPIGVVNWIKNVVNFLWC